MNIENYDIVGSYNNQRFASIDAERSVNLFEYHDELAKKPKSLIPTSGLDSSDIEFGSTTGGFRASFFFNGIAYHVIGNKLWQVKLVGSIQTPFLINSSLPFTTSAGYVAVDANTFQIIFVDGVKGYIYDTTANTFNQITDSSFPAQPIDVCFLDGFFVVASGGTPNFLLSSNNQGMVWGAASNNFSASVATNKLTINASILTGGPSGTSNYATGISFTVSPPTTGDAFTGAAATSLLTITAPATTVNYPTGAPVMLSGASLPTPLNATTKYYCINVDASTIKLATSYNNAITNMPITLTGDGSGTIKDQIPDGLSLSTTYYSIFVDATTIKVASSLANAQSGTTITLLSNGGGNNVITSLGQLQQGSITTHPGNIVACRTLHRRLFLFSSFYTEIWENAGIGTNLPFRRNNSVVMEYGASSVGSISVGFDKMMFLSQDRDGLGPVMMVIGTEAIQVSTKALDFQLAQYASSTGIADCIAFLIRENGLIFYRMNFTTSNHTFVYNLSMSDPSQESSRLWHEEETLTGKRHPAQTHIFFNGTNYVGDYLNPILYEIDSDIYTNDGEHIRRMRIGKPFVPPGYQRIRINRFQVDLLQGSDQDFVFDNVLIFDEIGLNNLITENSFDLETDQTLPINQDNDPVVCLSISKDGGQTYGNVLKAPMGDNGQRTFRTVWRKLGTTVRGQAFVVKLEFFDPIPIVILGAAWDYEVLPE